MQINLTDRYFSFVESLKTSDRIVFKLLILIFVISTTVVLVRAHEALLVDVPRDGGELVEGIVGTPRFVNPILAVTSADRDMVSLIYSGIMRLSDKGTLTEDLAKSLTVSDDGLTYNVVLKEDARFHDGTPVTADDVIFTISQIQDPAIKSPLRASWEGVTTEKLGERELNIILPEPYAPFIENLTVGILPKHIWEFASAEEFPFSQYNSEPVGSGPYRVSRIIRGRSGIPESYILTPFTGSYEAGPRIESLRVNFYPNEERLVEALKRGEVSAAASLSEERLAEISQQSERTYELHTSPLPRTFAVFLNQNESPLFRDRGVRRALEAAVDREKLVEDIFEGYATPITSPIPPGFGVTVTSTPTTSDTSTPIDKARSILKEAGWEQNEESGMWEKESGETTLTLRFSLSTVNTTEFQEIAEFLKSAWEELGVAVEIKRFEQSDLTQTVIRPRKYDALLFGTEVGRELDLYSFWHSSQRNDPGLNVALYANITTDSILAEARTTNNFEDREDAYQRFATEITDEVPAIFLFVPRFVYVTNPEVTGIDLTGVAHPSERFSGIRDWYIETETLWKFLNKQNEQDTS